MRRNGSMSQGGMTTEERMKRALEGPQTEEEAQRQKQMLLRLFWQHYDQTGKISPSIQQMLRKQGVITEGAALPPRPE
jgi:hypothetical protein